MKVIFILFIFIFLVSSSTRKDSFVDFLKTFTSMIHTNEYQKKEAQPGKPFCSMEEVCEILLDPTTDEDNWEERSFKLVNENLTMENLRFIKEVVEAFPSFQYNLTNLGINHTVVIPKIMELAAKNSEKWGKRCVSDDYEIVKKYVYEEARKVNGEDNYNIKYLFHEHPIHSEPWERNKLVTDLLEIVIPLFYMRHFRGDVRLLHYLKTHKCPVFFDTFFERQYRYAIALNIKSGIFSLHGATWLMIERILNATSTFEPRFKKFGLRPEKVFRTMWALWWKHGFQQPKHIEELQEALKFP